MLRDPMYYVVDHMGWRIKLGIDDAKFTLEKQHSTGPTWVSGIDINGKEVCFELPFRFGLLLTTVFIAYPEKEIIPIELNNMTAEEMKRFGNFLVIKRFFDLYSGQGLGEAFVINKSSDNYRLSNVISELSLAAFGLSALEDFQKLFENYIEIRKNVLKVFKKEDKK